VPHNDACYQDCPDVDHRYPARAVHHMVAACKPTLPRTGQRCSSLSGADPHRRRDLPPSRYPAGRQIRLAEAKICR